MLWNVGAQVVAYTYDAWGVGLTITGAKATTIGIQNPLRYRGYVYDVETDLYYLESRYYDPEAGRFLNADGLVTTGQGFISNNMFTYCGNNPIGNIDPSGTCYYGKGGHWYHDNWEYIGGYERKPDPRIAEKQQQLSDMGFKNVTTGCAANYVYTIVENGIDTPEEEAHFLAQCAKETNYGKWLKEIGGKEYFSKKEYGYKYRGAGYIQLTWDYNYKSFAKAMGDDLIYTEGADYVAAHYAWQAAGWFWSKKKMNARIAEGASVKDITKVVKGSSGSWEARQEIYDKFIVMLGG